MTITIYLPWPDKRLNPHAKGQWRPKATATKEARWLAFFLAKKAKVPREPKAILSFDFHPPDKRRRDASNMPSMCKAFIDGIADAMGCDDNGFRVQWPDCFSEVVPGGRVVVRIIAPVEMVELRGQISGEWQKIGDVAARLVEDRK